MHPAHVEFYLLNLVCQSHCSIALVETPIRKVCYNHFEGLVSAEVHGMSVLADELADIITRMDEI